MGHEVDVTAQGRHVLILTVVFPPDNVSTAHQVGYIAQDLSAAGHRVTVVTTTPHSRPDAGVVVPPVRVIRIPVPHKGRSALRNAFIWLLFLIGSAPRRPPLSRGGGPRSPSSGGLLY